MLNNILWKTGSYANKLFDLIYYQYCYLSRSNANKAISSISGNINDKDDYMLVEAFWDNPHHWLRLAIFTQALRNVGYGNKIIGLCENNTKKQVVKSLKSLPLSNIEVIEKTKLNIEEKKKASNIAKLCKDSKSTLKIKFGDGFPASLFHDDLNKKELSATFNHNKKVILSNIERLIYYLKIFKILIAKIKPKAIILSHPTTTRFSTLLWVSVLKKIPVFILNYEHQHITIRKETKESFLQYSQGFPKRSYIDKLTKGQISNLIKIGKKYMSDLETGKEGQFSVVKVYGDGINSYKNKSEFINASQGNIYNKTVIILCSCFPDFPNTYGLSWYTDYLDWLIVTLETISEIKNVNWIIKPHPAEHMYGKKITVKKVVKDYLSKNILLFPEKGNGLDVQNYADIVLTPSGTAGLEYTARKKPVIVSRPTPYTSWGIGKTCNSKKEYIECLQNILLIKKPDKEMVNRALILLSLTFAENLNPDKRFLSLPYGILSYRLWPSLKSYIKNNGFEIRNEIELMEKWINSNEYSYHAYKQISLVKKKKIE